MNKIIIVVLAVLLVVSGGAGYYSITLQGRVDRLTERIADLEDSLDHRTASLDESISNLDAEIAGTRDSLAFLEGSIDSRLQDVKGGIAVVEQAINFLGNQMEELEVRFAESQSNVSRKLFDASVVFGIVGPSTVRITDGQNTIGTGFIYDDGGHVITAFHVIDELSPIIVVMADGAVASADVVGFSDISDIAVLELDRIPDAPPVTMGDSSLIEIGEPVAVIGSPLNLNDTLTAGIISQVNRFASYGLDDISVANLLQCDAPVNPGNSGGPLADARGEIIGVVVARIVASEGDGIYYAVASNKARRVADAIIDSGFFDHPWLGVGIVDLTPDAANALGLDSVSGVLVGEVFAGSPAADAGIRPDDVIVSMDGVPVNDTGDLTSYLGEYLSPGDLSVIEIIRGPQRLEITVVIGSR